MKNKKRGQGIIEYVLLLMIPLLVISVLPNLNNTFEMTLSTVGVDLLEEMGDIEVSCMNGECEDIVTSTIYPPVAKFDLPENCGQTGIYQKGRPIRLINSSYDVDGDIDHLQWWIERKDVNGRVDTACTTPADQPIIVNRADLTNLTTGLTLSGIGYGSNLVYGERECMRDPGSYKVTLRVYDNDGLVSQPYSDTFEIRDVRPSISISASVTSLANGSPTDSPGTVTQKIVSDACKFSPSDDLKNEDDKDNETQSFQVEGNNARYITFDGHKYAYLETCPYIEGMYTGSVTFTINNYSNNSEHGISYTDPDFVAVTHDNVTTNQKFEGETNAAKNRHGFTYVSRFISSVVSEKDEYTIPTSTAQITVFETGASVYTKQFKEPGTYLFDASVWDENQVSAKSGAKKDGRNPNVGVAIRVLSPNDPDWKGKCFDPGGEEMCPKPKMILAIDKFGGDKEDTIYTAVGVYGKDKVANANVTASSMDYTLFNDNGHNIPSEKFSKTISALMTQAEQYLGMEVYKTTKNVNGVSTEFAVLAPATGERLRFRPLIYYGDESATAQKHCFPDAGEAIHYWATSDGYVNNYDFTNFSYGTAANVWNNSGQWGQVNRPYMEDNSTPYYSASNSRNLIGIPTYWNQTSNPIKNKSGATVNIESGEILYTMIRNNLAIEEYVDKPNPFGIDITEPINKVVTIDGSDIIFKNTQLRSNGQMIMIAPKNEMCPLPEQRPIPKLSIKANKVDIDGNTEEVTVELTSDINIEVDSLGNGTFTLNNEKYHIPCETTGCVVQVSSNKSLCGTGANEDCVIEGHRWGFDRVVTTGFPQYSTDDNIYYPNTVRTTKFTHTYYGQDTANYFAANPLDEDHTEDTIWGLPINKNTSSYAYYGDYDRQTDSPEIRQNPRFDWNEDDEETMVAPNARFVPSPTKTNNTTEDGLNTNLKPDLFTNNGGYVGYFIEAVDQEDAANNTNNATGYTYNLEIIDSQGCATSTTRTIKVTKKTDKPVAICNYIYHYVKDDPIINSLEGTDEWQARYDATLDESIDMLRRYSYYGGKMVQSISTFSDSNGTYYGDQYVLPVAIENGDNVKMDEEIYGYTAHNDVRVSPLFMFSHWPVFRKESTSRNPDIRPFNINSNTYNNGYRGDDTDYFSLAYDDLVGYRNLFISMYDKSREYLYSDKPEDVSGYNPRTAQILTGENISEYLNASGALLGTEEEPLQSTGTTGIKANWKIYKTTPKMASTVTKEELLEAWDGNAEFAQSIPEQIRTGEQFEYQLFGASFEEPTEADLVCESNGRLLEEGPVDCNGRLNSQGYYIVKLQLDNTNLPTNDPNKYSEVIDCRIKVKIPTLDFKCPWGETVNELNENAIEFETDKVLNENSGFMTEVIVSGDKDVDVMEFARTFVGNDRINSIEVTPFMYQDPYLFDVEEAGSYSETVIQFIDLVNPNNRYTTIPLNTRFSGDVSDIGYDTFFVKPSSASTPLSPLSLGGADWDWETNRSCTESNSSVCAIKTLPLELWLVRYHVSEITHNKNAYYTDTELVAEYDHLLNVIRNNLDTDLYTEEQINLTMEPLTPNDLNHLGAVFAQAGNITGSKEMEIINLYTSNIAEIISYKYDKSRLTWSDLQPYSMPELKYDWEAGEYRNSAIADFYYGKIRKNIVTADNPTVTNQNPYSAIWGTERAGERTPFFGKYQAVKRFMAVNFFDFTEPENPSPIYQSFKNQIESMYVSPIKKANSEYTGMNDRELYYDYKTVSLNQGEAITNSNLLSTPVRMRNNGTSLNNTELNTFVSGLSFTDIPYNTLEMNRFKKPGWQMAEQILNQASFDRGTRSSKLVYLRVNVLSDNQHDYVTYDKLNGSTVSKPNAYSKICPIVVKKKPVGVNNVVCNLTSTNMTSPHMNTGNENDGYYFYAENPDVANGVASLLPYRINGDKMLKFTHSEDDTAIPILNIEASKDMIISAREEGATQMVYGLTVDGGSTTWITIDITGISPAAPTDAQFSQLQTDFRNAVKNSNYNKKSTNNDLSTDATSVWIAERPMSESECNAMTPEKWMTILNNYDDTLNHPNFFNYFTGTACQLKYNNDTNNDGSGDNNYYNIKPLNYSFAFLKNGVELELDNSNYTAKYCTMYTAHSSRPQETWGKPARIWLGDVYNRIQYIGEDTIQHADYSVNTRTGTRKPGNGTYPSGTLCYWEISSSSHKYNGTTHKLAIDSTYAGKPAYEKWNGDKYHFLSASSYFPGARIQENCTPVINGNTVYTNVDIRDPFDYTKTGFVVQRLWIHQNAQNQVCYDGQGQVFVNAEFPSGHALAGNKSYCRAGTMYAVTKNNGKGNVVVVGNSLRGSDVFFAIEYQNGQWSDILEGVDQKFGGKLWVYANY